LTSANDVNEPNASVGVRMILQARIAKLRSLIIGVSALIVISASQHAIGNDKMISDARESIKSMLKDPYSVVFENMHIARGADGSPIVCGEYNAKNSYGAYVGRKKFFYIIPEGKKSILQIEEDPGVFDAQFIAEVCSQK
jgi:hypothetical protein